MAERERRAAAAGDARRAAGCRSARARRRRSLSRRRRRTRTRAAPVRNEAVEVFSSAAADDRAPRGTSSAVRCSCRARACSAAAFLPQWREALATNPASARVRWAIDVDPAVLLGNVCHAPAPWRGIDRSTRYNSIDMTAQTGRDELTAALDPARNRSAAVAPIVREQVPDAAASHRRRAAARCQPRRLCDQRRAGARESSASAIRASWRWRSARPRAGARASDREASRSRAPGFLNVTLKRAGAAARRRSRARRRRSLRQARYARAASA